MGRVVSLVLGIVMIITISVTTFAFIDQGEAQSEPKTNNGKKWRIAYCETDPFIDFSTAFYYIIQGLEEMGWVQGTKEIPFTLGKTVDTKEMWKWLNENNIGPYIEFVGDAHYSLIDAPDLGTQMVERIKTKKDIDLIIAMGTTSGKILVDGDHSIPMMVFEASDAVGSEIVDSPQDSGKDHVWAHIDENRFKRQLKIFHDIFTFETMGIVYEDSEVGRAMTAVKDVEEIAKERGFEIKRYFVDEPKSDEDRERYHAQTIQAHQKLAKEVDAFYLTYGPRDNDELYGLLAPFYQQNIPAFSQAGDDEVKNGALLSISRADFSSLGQFGAVNIARVLNGEHPRALPQVYEETPSIALNMDIAHEIGYKPKFEILLSADKIYRKE